MKKIIISIAALAALSTAGLANDRSEDYNSAYRNVHFGSVHGTKPMSSGSVALSVEARAAASTDQSDFAYKKLRGIEHFIERGSNGRS